MLLCLSTVAWADPTGDATRDAYLVAVERMVEVAEAAESATWTFYQQEWVEGEQQPRQVMEVKYRRGGDIYLRYVGDAYKGREVLYAHRDLPGEIVVNPSSLIPTLTLDLHGRLAMDGQRYGTDDMALDRTVAFYVTDLARLRAIGWQDFVVEDLGARDIAGELAHCWRTIQPKDRLPDLHAYRVETCIADRSEALVLMKAWDVVDHRLVLVEDYVWAGLRLGAPLSDRDFDRDNPAYGF